MTTKNDVMATRMELENTPRLSAVRSAPCSAFSCVRTKNVPATEDMTHTAAITIGMVMELNPRPRLPNAATPSAIVATIDPTYDS